MSSNSSSSYDTVVIGAGHNGLTAATLLARTGKKVLVLEKQAKIGGLCASIEFHPGFKTSGILHDTSCVSQEIVDTLNLRKYGLVLESTRPRVGLLNEDKSGVVMGGSHDEVLKEVSKVSSKDADSYQDYVNFLGRIGCFVRQLMSDPPPEMKPRDIGSIWTLGKTALRFRGLGKKDMLEFLRVAPMCVADWLNDQFETDFLKGAMAWPSVFGSYYGPWSPGSNLNLILWECLSKTNIQGGPAALISALEKAATENGVELQTEKEVSQIIIENGQVKGLELVGGEKINARQIFSSLDPKHTFLRLIHSKHMTLRLENRLRNFRTRGTAAKLHFAIKGEENFGFGSDVTNFWSAVHVDKMEKAFDAVKYRQFSNTPLIDVQVVSHGKAPTQVPAGHSLVSVIAQFAPYDLGAEFGHAARAGINGPCPTEESGWTSEAKQSFTNNVISQLENYAPGFRNKMIAQETLTPFDLEKEYGISGGHLLHGEPAPDQLVIRPIPECAYYQTPIKGLSLCGGGAHPGGGVSCVPGALAARAIK